jgi:hypothetical protein
MKPSRQVTRPPVSVLPRLLFLLAVAGLVLSAGTVPHSHDGPGIGLWNHEHDLTQLAIRGSHALLPDIPVVPPATAVLAGVPHFARTPLPTLPRRHADPRAPPLA